jgi:hypothetical protein
MSLAASLNPSQQQILVNLGNRYVVFGPAVGLPEPLRFSPDKDSEILRRAVDEGEISEARVIQTLRVSGMKKLEPDAESSIADVKLVADNGDYVLVDVKVRESEPKQRDFRQGFERVGEAARGGKNLQVWYLNIERLKLSVIRIDEQSRPQVDQLNPLDVWEKSADGVFNRANVVEEVDDWAHRISTLYRDVKVWLSDHPGLRYDESRTVTMSEELMQRFAAPDRELPVLDILRGDQVVVSFVPRGLWLIGAWGRVDMIAPDRTEMLIAIRREDGKFEWRLTSSNNRRQTAPFDRNALLAIVPSP